MIGIGTAAALDASAELAFKGDSIVSKKAGTRGPN